jgi:hypothetical protein
MKTNRFLVYAILLLCILSGSASLLVAQDATEGAEGEEIVEVAEIEEIAEEEEQKKSAAHRFALFLEAGGGALAVDDIKASIRNNSTFSSSTIISFSDFTYGYATIGWKLPNDKGRFEATYHGHREDSYSMNAQGLYGILPPESDIGFDALPLIPWWTMEVGNGTLHSEMFVPFWSADVNDTNSDGSVDLDEIVYPDTPAVVVDNPAHTDMQNSLQTYDVAYRRLERRLAVHGVRRQYPGHVLDLRRQRRVRLDHRRVPEPADLHPEHFRYGSYRIPRFRAQVLPGPAPAVRRGPSLVPAPDYGNRQRRLLHSFAGSG